ncbi:olfactory receptor 52E8-like [Garra rufa]|uniref:olfactory receptor 52E8-like n=1 Tax=Garra rufa TaxID=137080 RepID=UPI003CCEA393
MSSLNTNFSKNISIVRPEYFFILGLSGIAYGNYYYVFLFIIYFITVIGNTTVILIVAINQSLHSAKYFAMFNMALANIGETNALIPNMMKTFFSDSQYISYNSCLANMFFVYFFIAVQSVTLVVMAYDRFIAICLPLRYHALVNNNVMSVVLSVAWAFSASMVGLLVSLITQISFCESNVIQSYFCDHAPVLRLACNLSSIITFIRNLNAVLFFVAPFFIIVLSYIGIFFAVSKITTWEARLKALKTCVSHLLLVMSFFLSVMCISIIWSNNSLTSNAGIIITSLAYGISPMLNPIIYVLNTVEIKVLIRKVFNNRSANRRNASR